MKRTLATVLALVMLLTVLPLGAVGVSAGKYGDLTYRISGGKVTIERCATHVSGSVVIPSTIDGYPVVAIDDHAFYNCYYIDSVTIPNRVTTIGESAFESCNSLVDVTIPNSVTTIEKGAFSFCRDLTSVTLPNSVRTIGESAFSQCTSLLSVTIPKSVTTIEKNTFYNCSSLEEVTLPDTLETIGSQAFAFCEELSSITIPASITAMGRQSFHYCSRLTAVHISDLAAWCAIDFEDETANPLHVAHYLYLDDEMIEDLVIPDDVTAIKDYAFYNCENIVSIKVSKKVKTIGRDAFANCAGVEWAYVPKSVTAIGFEAFDGCDSLTEIVLPFVGDNVDGRGHTDFDYIFGYTVPASLKYVMITGDVDVADHAFAECRNIERIAFIGKVTSFGERAFQSCDSLKSLRFPATLTKVEEWALDGNPEFTDVYFVGTVNQDKVYIEDWNRALENATWNYNACYCYKGHEFNPATCTKPKTCKICGATSGKALGHKYGNACDKSCDRCKSTRSTTHSYVKTATKKATLTTNGTAKNVCSVCGYTASTTTTIYKASKISLSKTSYTYTGKEQKPTVVVKDSQGKTISSSNYTVTYASGRKAAGTYKVTVKMKGLYSGTKTLTYKINPIDVSKCKITLSATSYTYNGAVKKPTVTVKNAAGTKLTEGGSYTVTYATGRKNVGTYKVTIKMKGNYTGTKTLTFKINPTKTSISKLTGASKSLKVTWSKKTAQVTGYEIQYSTSKSFSSYKSKLVTSNKTTSATIKSLSAKKTYYVRVRTYKTVNGKKVYSGWSAVKSVKTK